MSRLTTIPASQATGKAAELFSKIKAAMGKVPNAYATIGANAPDILEVALTHNAVLKKGTLSAKQLETINLAVSEASGCDYCLAAHTLTAKVAGFTVEQIKRLRQADYSDDQQLNILAKFSRHLVSSRGTVAVEQLQELQQGGFTDRQVVEILSAISAILFTNMVNRVNDTVLDFPRVN